MSVPLLTPSAKTTHRLSKVAAADRERWRQACQQHLRDSHIKRADLGGGDSVPFEQAFSNLAHAYAKDKAPGLLDYELGFQLLEKNEDNDKAVGIFGFKIGPQLIYAPVFFINGELKGHELMYLKDSDTFVPLKENWVNYVLNRKPHVLGEEANRNIRALGVERPSMDIFRESPGKYSSDQSDWLEQAMPGLSNALLNPRPTKHELVVPDLVKTSAAAANQFLSIIDASPSLGRDIIRLYGPQLIKEAMVTAAEIHSAVSSRPKTTPKERTVITGSAFQEKSAEEVARSQDPFRTGALRVFVYSGTPAPGLTSKEAQDLKRDGIYIKDDRETASRIYKVQKPLSMMNPDATGIYDVLCKPDSFERCLVVMAPHGRNGRRPGCVLVRLDDDGNKAWANEHPGNIFADPIHGDAEYKEWFDGLDDVKTLENGAVYVALAPDGQGTSPFEVEIEDASNGTDEKCYQVDWKGCWGNHRPDHLPPIGDRGYEYANYPDGVDRISLGAKGGSKIVSRVGTLYLPPRTKVMKLKDPDPDNDYPRPCSMDASEPRPIRPGTHVDLQLGIYKMSEELKVFNSGTEAIINGDRMNSRNGLLTLVRDYGLREKAARELLKNAQVKGGQKVRIKYAQPYDLIRSAPTAPSVGEGSQGRSMGTDTFFGTNLPLQMYDEEEIPVQGMHQATSNKDMYNASRPPDPQTMQSVTEAAQTGQKEVLDTSLLASLLKGTRDDTLIDKYLGDLVKGLDRIGRLLFNFYWHYDKFEDRYGSGDLPELEDSLRNSFESLGDLVLFLKQKSIEPFPGEGQDVDLAPSAEV